MVWAIPQQESATGQKVHSHTSVLVFGGLYSPTSTRLIQCTLPKHLLGKPLPVSDHILCNTKWASSEWLNVTDNSSIIYMELTAQKEKVTGEKGPATTLELGTYALTRSSSHASHGDRSRSFISLMYQSQVAAIQRRLRPAPWGWYCVRCDGSKISGARVHKPEMESCSISLYVQ